MIDVPVLIVGGGPVGMMTSLLLSQSGIKALLVERHPGTATLPKARSLNARTMEVFRQIGLENDIRQAGMPPEYGGMIVWAESLAGTEIERLRPGRGSAQNLAVSPVRGAGCAQDILEPILRHQAEVAHPGSLHFNTELVSFKQDNNGVTGSIIDRGTGDVSPFRARYLVAADGAKSRVRDALGIRLIGTRDIYDSVNIHFRADLREWTAGRPASLYMIEQPDLSGTFLTINGSDRWGFLVQSISNYGYKVEDFTPEFCVEILRRAAGVPDLKIEILGAGAWKASATVAERYQDGSIFLVGDAAHEMPPTGGFGLNTGVQDAQNLAWKLAAVLRGEANESLLETYEAERRLQAKLIVQAAHLSAISLGRTARRSAAKMPRSEFLNEQGLIFGARYESAAVIPDGSAPILPTNTTTEYLPSAYPGGRAPHVWLKKSGDRISTIDLFGTGFVLLAGPLGTKWRQAASAQKLVAIETYIIGSDLVDAESTWQSTYGTSPDGAVLVRPDGYVAWRAISMPSDPAGELNEALTRLLGICVEEAAAI